MTTHDQPTRTTIPTDQMIPDKSTESSTSQSDSVQVETPPSAAPVDPPRANVEPVELPDRQDEDNMPTAGQPQAAASGPDRVTEISLFGETELSGFRSRWDDVQAAFVDDPRGCVQKADGLVGRSSMRSPPGSLRHAPGWRLSGRGEEVSTEDLRLALKRYREFSNGYWRSEGRGCGYSAGRCSPDLLRRKPGRSRPAGSRSRSSARGAGRFSLAVVAVDVALDNSQRSASAGGGE